MQFAPLGRVMEEMFLWIKYRELVSLCGHKHLLVHPVLQPQPSWWPPLNSLQYVHVLLYWGARRAPGVVSQVLDIFTSLPN